MRIVTGSFHALENLAAGGMPTSATMRVRLLETMALLPRLPEAKTERQTPMLRRIRGTLVERE